MSGAWNSFAAKFEALSLRERRLATIAGAVVAAALVYAVGVAPSETASRKLTRELQSAQSQQAAQAAQIDQLRATLALDPDAQRKAELTALQDQIAALDTDLAALQPDLVSPQQMLELVRALVARHAGRELVGMRALPPQAVSFEAPAEPPSGDEPNVIGRRPATKSPSMTASASTVPVLYRHAVELELRADYNTALGYLREIEALPARLHVERLHIDAEHWPRLHVRLRIQTLSLHEGWAGV